MLSLSENAASTAALNSAPVGLILLLSGSPPSLPVLISSSTCLRTEFACFASPSTADGDLFCCPVCEIAKVKVFKQQLLRLLIFTNLIPFSWWKKCTFSVCCPLGAHSYPGWPPCMSPEEYIEVVSNCGGGNQKEGWG